MGIIGWLILGLIAGAVARAILPGKQPGGWIAALITGVLGAMLGGFLASALFGVGIGESFFDLGTWIFAIAGGVIVAFLWQALTGRGRSEV